MLTQQKLTSVTTESATFRWCCSMNREGRAPSMTRLLMGVLDKAALRWATTIR
jgi:hypothetical protein